MTIEQLQYYCFTIAIGGGIVALVRIVYAWCISEDKSETPFIFKAGIAACIIGLIATMIVSLVMYKP